MLKFTCTTVHCICTQCTEIMINSKKMKLMEENANIMLEGQKNLFNLNKYTADMGSITSKCNQLLLLLHNSLPYYYYYYITH